MAKLVVETEIGPITLVGSPDGLEEVHLTPLEKIEGSQSLEQKVKKLSPQNESSGKKGSSQDH